ncbi:MAG: 3-dehydroquinate synthase [Pseudomonadota bacterium]
MAEDTVRVALAERSYDIHIGAGLIDTAGDRLKTVLARPRVAIVTDETVADLHLERLKNALDAGGIEHNGVILPAGEQTKSFAHLEALIAELLEMKVERRDALVAFGGGVIGDLTGFAAATLRRGCDFIQIPTTLLAQVDSSVGGKTGINVAQGKNLVGAFHQPKLVLADTDVLNTLSEREFLAGYAEVVKYGLLGDAAFFDWLEANGAALKAGSADKRVHAIKVSCNAKAAVVAQDEREGGVRALLNLGHTFGHALEAACGYDGRLLHGEGVAVGMCLAFDFSAAQGLCPAEDAVRARSHLAALGLPTRLSDIKGAAFNAAELVDHMRQDKKVVDGALTFILAHRIGEAFIQSDVAADTIEAFLADHINTA